LSGSAGRVTAALFKRLGFSEIGTQRRPGKLDGT